MTAWVFVLYLWGGANYAVTVPGIATADECARIGNELSVATPNIMAGRFKCVGYRARVK